MNHSKIKISFWYSQAQDNSYCEWWWGMCLGTSLRADLVWFRCNSNHCRKKNPKIQKHWII